MTSYDDEAMSRILGEHDTRLLHRAGRHNWEESRPDQEDFGGCINQAAFNEGDKYAAKYRYGLFALTVGIWFDEKYSKAMTAEEILEQIEKATRTKGTSSPRPAIRGERSEP